MFSDLTLWTWSLLILCALFTGLNKVGVAGLGMLVLPLMAEIFDPKLSVGILLPMLITGDLLGAWHYRRDVDWPQLFRLVPWVAGGITVGAIIGKGLSADWFRYLIALAIVLGLIPLLAKGRKGKQPAYPSSWWFSALFGLAAGFFTMVGNAAGALMNIYLLSMRLPKNHFIGTRAWFFLIVNIAKVPLHVMLWKTITVDSLSLNAMMIPFICVGGYFGIALVRKIREEHYRILIIVLIIIALARLLIGN